MGPRIGSKSSSLTWPIAVGSESVDSPASHCCAQPLSSELPNSRHAQNVNYIRGRGMHIHTIQALSFLFCNCRQPFNVPVAGLSGQKGSHLGLHFKRFLLALFQSHLQYTACSSPSSALALLIGEIPPGQSHTESNKNSPHHPSLQITREASGTQM